MNKTPVTENSVVARVRRKLRKEGEILKKCSQNSKWYSTLGDYYIVNLERNCVDHSGLDLELLARETGCLKEYEEIV